MIDRSKICVSHGKETRKRCLPLELRLRLYNEVLRLRGQGLSYNDIMKRIHRLNGVRLSKSHISYWVRGLHAQLGRVNRFNAKPSPELASIIGVTLSDGNLNSHSDHNYGISLRVKDIEYAYEFSRNLAKALGRRKLYRLSWSHSRRY